MRVQLSPENELKIIPDQDGYYIDMWVQIDGGWVQIDGGWVNFDGGWVNLYGG